MGIQVQTQAFSLDQLNAGLQPATPVSAAW